MRPALLQRAAALAKLYIDCSDTESTLAHVVAEFESYLTCKTMTTITAIRVDTRVHENFIEVFVEIFNESFTLKIFHL